jgi:tRNA (cmo5U34)-methyltransferase
VTYSGTSLRTGKADLFRRVADVPQPGGRYVLGDVVVPEDPADAIAPIDGDYDSPSSVADQLRWLEDAGFATELARTSRDLVVLVGDVTARPVDA